MMAKVAESNGMPISESLRFAMHSFGVDQVTAEVTAALAKESIEVILLKGPAITTWLYDGELPRLYSDTDLLLQRRDWTAAMTVIGRIGFEDDLGALSHPRMESGAGHLWVRPTDEAEVDLHYTLFGVGVEPEALWSEFSAGAVEGVIGGRRVVLPGYSARLFHIALHAVQHGGTSKVKPMLDLERAISKVDSDLWRDARALADRLGAGEAFAAGLRLLPEGQQLATAIGAGRGWSPYASIRLEGVPLAEGFQSFAETQGVRAKAALALREFFPSTAFMRWWLPLATRGRPGLLAAYAWRLCWLTYRAIPGYLAWRRASRRLVREAD